MSLAVLTPGEPQNLSGADRLPVAVAIFLIVVILAAYALALFGVFVPRRSR